MTVTAAQLTNLQMWAYLSGAWVDITADVYAAEKIIVSYGMATNKEVDRLAATGSMKFSLDNSGKKYTPGSGSMLSGWMLGVPMELTMDFDSVHYVKFRGFLADINIDPGTKGPRKAHITCLDWFDYAAKFPLVSPGIVANQRADQALNTIVSSMPIQPIVHTYDNGVNIFPALFDSVTTKTKAYTEMSKLAASEIGYIYLRRDGGYGENLVFENQYNRNGLRTLTQFGEDAADAGFLLLETADYLLLEDGGKLVFDIPVTLLEINNMVKLDAVYGQNMINRMNVIAYPKRIDISNQVLYSLQTPMLIGAGQSVTFRGNYSDPSGGATVTADSSSMITPAATTDYQMFQNSDGSGTDYTANLTVSVTYGTEAPNYTLTNTASVPAWVTKLQARGHGIYAYNPITTSKESSVSYNQYGYQDETLTQLYQRTLDNGTLVAQAFLDYGKNPRTVLNRIWMSANATTAMMQAFLKLDVGDLISVTEDQTGISGWYYINGVDFTIQPGGNGIIFFSYLVKQSFSLSNGLSLIACEYAGGTDGINFGYLPQVSNLPQRSDSVWVYITSLTGVSQGFITIGGVGQGYFMGMTNNKEIEFYQVQAISTGIWKTPTNSISLNAWHHVVCTRDVSTVTNAPLIYIDGVLQTLTVTQAPSGAIKDQTGQIVVCGNAFDYAYPVEGKIKDLRTYNRILSSTDVSAIYAEGAGGTSTLTGLLFQTFCVRTSELSHYTNLTLTDDDKLLDNIYNMVGSKNGSPITRLV